MWAWPCWWRVRSTSRCCCSRRPACGGVAGTDTIDGAHAAIVATLGPAIGVVFAIGLLASGLASTSVGTYAGSTIMGGLLKVQVPLLVRQGDAGYPALVVLALGVDPTRALVLSQVVLSFGIPFALIPLVLLASSKPLMGSSPMPGSFAG